MKNRGDCAPGRAADAALATAILVLGILLGYSGVVMLERWRESSSRRQSLQLEDVLGGVSAGSGALIVFWWLASLILAVASARLQRAGHNKAADAMGRTSPAFMRRLALAAVGLQLVAGPVAANAAPAATETGSISAVWAPATQQGGDAGAFGPPQWTGTHDGVDMNDPVQPQWKPTAPLNDARLFAAPPLRSAPAAVPSALSTQVIVLSGDSLWTIAARALGPQASDFDVAMHWPRWYEANRATIGDDPDVLLPGQILQAPAAV